MKVILLGSGNTATVLAKMIVKAEHEVVQVWSRNFDHAKALAAKVRAQPIATLDELSGEADLCIMAVSDAAIPQLAKQLQLRRKVLVHTAGSVSRDVLRNSSPNYGVLYPLQSLRKEMLVIPPVPFLIDGNSDEVNALLEDFAHSLSDNVQFVDDAARLNMHLAAVMVSNFTNHLYALTEDYCKDRNLDFKLLHPLIIEVACRLTQGHAVDMQTGPARRGDEETIKKHLLLLEIDEHLQDLYRELSESIQKLYRKK
ncbi:DUF2520 domain-containing protein [Lacibacter luteus]|uniref:DUF2520 domain-containing protein n=1 Tax=Lacibacter luteus TaxID=2508719 RepID=A0A4Q1CGT3_9BACT|nr:DUF2520 domain-containing protein [Lacibacter luteus]RXK59000.1 DUF2520 domain-containing protein [Lacibacter luteus]